MENSIKYRQSASTAFSTALKSRPYGNSSGMAYESRWKQADDVPKLGAFSDIYEAAKDHVHFT